MQMRMFLLRALVLLLIALATESVLSDEQVDQVSELPEESQHPARTAKAPATGDVETIHEEQSLVQFGTGLGIGDALGFNDPPPDMKAAPPPPPKMPPAIKAYMPLEAEPGEVMPPTTPRTPAPTPMGTQVWEDTPLPEPFAMDTMPVGFVPGETMPPPVMAVEEVAAKKKLSKAKTQAKPSPKENTEEDTLLEDPEDAEDTQKVENTQQLEETFTGRSVPRRVNDAESVPRISDAAATRVRKKAKRAEARMMPPLPGSDNIWDINMEEEHPDWQPESIIQKRLVAGMPKVPARSKPVDTQKRPMVLAREFGHRLQVIFHNAYTGVYNLVWGEWSPKWAKYQSGIFSVLFALVVAVAPIVVLLFVTLMRFVSSKLKERTSASAPASDAEKGEVVDSVSSDAMFYTSRMFPVD